MREVQMAGSVLQAHVSSAMDQLDPELALAGMRARGSRPGADAAPLAPMHLVAMFVTLRPPGQRGAAHGGRLRFDFLPVSNH